MTKPTSTIFRAYDIRGVYPTELNESVAYGLGRAFARNLPDSSPKRVVIGKDARLSGPAISEALQKGLRDEGVDVLDIGQVISPMIYFAVSINLAPHGIMVTGSHNPKNYNGFKMMMGGKPLTQAMIQQLREDWCALDTPAKGLGALEQQAIDDRYQSAVLSKVSVDKPFKVVLDTGNGAAGPILLSILNALGCEVLSLHTEPNGHFPGHHPDPSKPENLQDVIDAVTEHKADVGLALDGDGDRLGVISPTGRIIWPDQLLMKFAESVLKTHPGAPIAYDVKCSSHLTQTIHANGGEPLLCPTGHAFIKRAIREHHAALGGEMSGHFFFNDQWFGFDDAAYAAVRWLALMAEQADLASFWRSIPALHATPEINIPMPDAQKFDWIARFVQSAPFEGATLVTIDGLRVEWPEGWGLIRASNTTPCLVARFEGRTPEDLERIKSRFLTAIQTFDNAVSVPI